MGGCEIGEHVSPPGPLFSLPGMVQFPTPISQLGRNWLDGKGRCFFHADILSASWPTALQMICLWKGTRSLIVPPRHSHSQLPRCLYRIYPVSCLPDTLPRISEPFPSIRAHRVHLLRTQKAVILSNPRPGSQTKLLALFVSTHGWNRLFGNSWESFSKHWVNVS